MTDDIAHFEITVEGDKYDISEWEERIQELNDDLDVTVESCDVE